MIKVYTAFKTGPEVIKLFSCSTQLSKKLILLINVKMPTIVGILTVISRINTASESIRVRKICIFQHFSLNEQLKFHVQLSIKKVLQPPGYPIVKKLCDY